MKSFTEYLAEGIDPKTYNLQRLYGELNVKLFSGELPKNINISFGKLKKGVVGTCTAAKIGRNTYVPGSAKITVSPRSFAEDSLKGVVAHEMVHLWVFMQNDFQTNHDGPFLTKLNEIRKKASFPINVSHTSSEEELESIPEKKVAIIILTKPNGTKNFALYSLNSHQKNLIGVAYFVKLFVHGDVQPHVQRVQYGTITTRMHLAVPIQRKFDEFGNLKFYNLKPDADLSKFVVEIDEKDR
jgi:hypothetical protein